MDIISDERLKKSLILVVDDIELNVKMLVHSLQARGFCNIIVARNGSEALTVTQEKNPDIVILDLMMPVMDGFDYCDAVRDDKRFNNMPIIVQTVLEEIEKKLRAFKSGATDYICKPLDPEELVARTTIHLTQKLLMEDLREYRKRVTAELDSAKLMQNRLLPAEQQSHMYERMYDLKIGSYFETSSHLGGDCWGMRPISETRLALWMYDFSGHGISAAMNVFRTHTIIQELVHSGAEPGNFLTALNRQLYALLERHEFATMFYAIIDTESNCLLYASAAMQPPVLYSGTQQEAALLHGRGFPLGVISNATYDTKYTPFAHNDLLLLYSDCLVETTDASNAYINDKQIKDTLAAAIRKSPNDPARQAVDSVLTLFRRHNPAPIVDDMTLNAYWRCPRSDG